jgi:PhoH-like ATPase
MRRKIFVIDTSLLLHDPSSLLSFGDNIIVIPFPVLEELDEHKRRGENGTATYARQAIRILDDLREKGSLDRGVRTPDGGVVIVDSHPTSDLKGILSTDTTDNFIIGVAHKWANHQTTIKKSKLWRNSMAELELSYSLGEVSVITKDINLRVKAGACGLKAQDYRKDKAAESADKLYTGIAHLPIPEGSSDELFRALHSAEQGIIQRGDLEAIMPLPPLFPNQACIFEENTGKGRTGFAIYKEQTQPYLVYVPKPKGNDNGYGGIEPRNFHQSFALALLTDTSVRIVTLSGIAGGGKTLMALLAGLKQLDKVYDQILIYRSNTEIGEPLGFLKGSLKQKFGPWARPIHDVLELLDNGGEREAFETKSKRPPLYGIEKLLNEGRIEIEPINYLRGRSFHNKFVVIDETQNFRPGDVKKVISRIGKGTKIVLTGDAEQIDSPYLDVLSNGLSHVTERLKGQPMFGHITLEKSERDEIVDIAARLL